MRILNDFKIPNFKFPKLKMKDVENIEEVKVNYERMQKKQVIEQKRKIKGYETTYYKTIKEIFEMAREKYSDNIFMLEKFNTKGEFTKITYKEFTDDVIALGTALTNKYKLKNERIVIIGENTYNWYVSYMSVLCGVGIAVPVDKELPANEIENVIHRSRATAVIYSTKKKDIIKKVQDKLPEVKYFIQMNNDDKLNGRDVGFNTVVNQGKKMLEKGDDSFLKIEIDPEEFKVLIFTSGTTSNSKGVMICNRNLAQNINAVNPYAKLHETDRFFSILPLHHTYESSIGFLLPVAKGSSIVVCQGLKHIVPDLKETKPTALLAVPLLIENLYKKINQTIEKSGKAGMVDSMMHITNALKNVGVDIKKQVFAEIYENLGGNLKFIVSAAAPIDPKVGKWLQDLGIIFMQGYGLTETAPIAALTPQYDTRVGSAGKAVNCAELKIDNPNENGEGEILIKSETLMIGYYEDEEATNEVIEIDKDGNRWFHSGDVGYLDENGFLYITGRIKNVIVTQNGKNVYPEEIELMLGDIPEIKECMIYGKKVAGQKELTITARVIPNIDEIKRYYEKEELTEEEIYNIIWNKIKEVNHKLSSYKAIKSLEIKKDEFVKTTTMKIKRYVEINKK
ncbi:MAG: long-chain fatty acid--CoA ligase [Clostridiaceae bacterium]|nr:long-chain fatty acid--CoA ligase [Clostridiaceae bacterium]